ncbi:hypothetical protein BH10PSE6_BH10PSE6_20530 [soil metagenome]
MSGTGLAATAALALPATTVDGLSRLLSKTLGLADLQRMVYLATGDDIFSEYLGPNSGDPLRTMILKLLQIFEQQGITKPFLTVVYRERPFRADVRGAIATIFPDVAGRAAEAPVVFQLQHAGVAQPVEAGAGPGLQKNIRPALKSPDVSIWIERIEAVRRQVCRIEMPGQAFGTGFLVGPNAVLTNWHVAEDARQALAAGQLVCRFDYRLLTGGGTDSGTAVQVMAIADELPCSPAELTAAPDDSAPKADELDYALLRLAAIPGATRGFASMAGVPVQIGEPLIIVQHPRGAPVRIAIDTSAVESYPHDGLRLRYRTNTEAGSSGSPCFNMDLDLVALHHLGDPARTPPTYNQGIPIDLVRASPQARGHGSLLTS